MQPAKVARLRSEVTRALDQLPAPWFRRLRAAYVDSVQTAPSSRRTRLLRSAVGVARFRSLPVDEVELFDYPGVRLHAADSLVTRMLYWYGGSGYEGAETEWWRHACHRATNVLELGANVGYYTLQGALANPACRYRAVEPHPDSAELVRRNLALNGIENVEVIEAAAVGTRGIDRLELSIPDQDGYATPAGAFVRDGGEGVDHLAAHRNVEVAAVAVQDLIEGVDLLKLDIEGHEAEVLEPIMDVLMERKPTLFVEVRLAEVPHLRAIVARLAASGYAVFAIGEDSLHLVTQDELNDAGRLPRYGSRDLMLVDAADVGDL
jgi:FkbM family methyltransferase